VKESVISSQRESDTISFSIMQSQPTQVYLTGLRSFDCQRMERIKLRLHEAEAYGIWDLH